MAFAAPDTDEIVQPASVWQPPEGDEIVTPVKAQVAAPRPLIASPVNQPSQFSSGLPPGTNPAENPDWGFTKATALPATLAIQAAAKKAGQGLDIGGRVLAAAVAHVVKNPGETLRGEVPAEDSDIAQVIRGETPDYELERGLLPKPLQAAESGAYGLVKTVPQLAGIAAAQAVGVPAPISAGVLFGLTPEGFDPKQAAIGAALPFVGKYGGAVSEAVAKKLGISSKTAVAAVNKIGAASASAGVIGIDQIHTIMQLPPDQREKAWVDAWGNVAGMAGLGLMGGGGESKVKPEIKGPLATGEVSQSKSELPPNKPTPAAPAVQERMSNDMKNAWAGKLQRVETIGRIRELEEGWGKEIDDPNQQHKLELLAERKAEISDERNRGNALQQYFDESSPEMQKKIDAHLEKLNANRKLNASEQQFDDFLEQQIGQRLNKAEPKPFTPPAEDKIVTPAKVSGNGTVRLYRGQDHTVPGGEYWSTDPTYARNFGQNVQVVDVPKSVADAGRAAVQKTGSGTPGAHRLPDEWVKKAQTMEKPPEQVVQTLDEPVPAVTATDLLTMTPEQVVAWKKAAPYGEQMMQTMATAVKPAGIPKIVEQRDILRKQAADLLAQAGDNPEHPAWGQSQVVSVKAQTLNEMVENAPKSPGGQPVPAAGGKPMMTIYRAGDANEVGVKKFSGWSEDEAVAKAYQDNPGFGGEKLRKEIVPQGRVLDADIRTRTGLANLAEKLGFSREEGDSWMDNGWQYPWEESSKVKKALETSGFDFIRYTDDFPQGAKTIVPLKGFTASKPALPAAEPVKPAPAKAETPAKPKTVAPELISIDDALNLAERRKAEGKSQLTVAQELSGRGLSDSDATGIAGQVYAAKAIPTEPKPVVAKSPIEILNTAKSVTVTLPEDATMLQVSHKKGVWGTPFDPSTLSKASGTRTANTFIGTDPIAVRGVSVGKGKEVKVSTGEVKIQPLETSAEKRARAISEFPKRQLSRAPGAAAGDEPGTYSAIQQLADQLEATGKENAPVNERVSAIEAVKVKATDLKDGVKSTLANVLAIIKALWDSYANLAPYTDMKRIVGKWFYANQRADFEAREFGKQIIKAVPDKLRREAITNWIQADGDVAALKERAAASRGALRRGYEIAQKLTPRETEIAQLIREYYDRQLERGINEGLLKEGLDNYITQVWKKENPITRKLMNDLVNSKLQPNFKFARKRIFDSYFEGEQSGLKPSKDAGFLVSNYDQSFNKSLAARAFIKDLHEGLASDGRPLVEVSGSGKLVDVGEAKPRFIIKPKATPEAIGDYKTIDHPALRGWKWLGKTPEGADVLLQGELKVHPEIYDKLKNRLSTSWFRQHPVPRTILNVQSTLKQSMMSISGFHQVQENLHALGHRVNPMNLEKLDFSEPVTKSLVEHGLQLADFNSLAEFGEGLSSGNLVSKIPLIGSKLQAYNDWLFQDNIPRLKLTMAKHALERNKERYSGAIKSGKITPDQVLELTASQANHAFGELPYKYWGRNPNLQDAYRTFLLAPDFLEARAGFAGQALKPGGLGAKGLLKNEQLQALALLALTQYITARIANQVIDDDPHWEFNNAFRIISGNHAWSLRTVPGDVIHLISDPRGFTFNRLSPVIGRGSIELATGRDYRGVKRDFLNQMGDLLKSGIPISMNHKNGQNILETFGNALGVQNQRYDAQQNIQQKAADFKSANNIKIAYETIYNPDDDKFSALRNAINEGNQKLAQTEFNKLKGIIPSAKIYQHFKLSLNRTLTGSRANDQKFYNGLNEVGKREYKMAQDLQRSRLKMALSLKTTSPETPQENYTNTPSVFRE